MSEWMIWLAAAGVLVICELFAATFYLLMVALGVAAGGIAAWWGAGMPVQTVTAAVIGVLATVLLRRTKYGRRVKVDVARDPNVNLDIGQRIVVREWRDGRARVMYRGAMWDVELAPGGAIGDGEYTIQAMHGSRLIVA